MTYAERERKWLWKDKPRLVVVKAVTYHRNGISGESFWTVRFRSPETEAEFRKGAIDGDFLATVPTDALTDEYEWKEDRAGECFVIYLPEPEMCWRGDHFATEIRRAIHEHQKAEDAKWAKR